MASPVRPREAPPFKVEKKARLRVNLEQAPALRPGESRGSFQLGLHRGDSPVSIANSVMIVLTKDVDALCFIVSSSGPSLRLIPLT
jgi:hypothetical protein